MNRGSWFFYLRLVIGVGFLVFLINSIEVTVFFSIFSRINLVYVLLVLIVNTVYFFIGAFNIWAILVSQSTLRFQYFINDYVSSTIINHFTPGQIGDSSLVFFLNKRGVPVRIAGTAFLLDKFITLSVFLFLSWYTSTVLLLQISFLYFMVLPVGGVLGIAALYWIFPYFNPHGIYLKKLKLFLAQAHEQILFLSKNIRLVFLNGFLTLIKWFVFSAYCYLSFLALGTIVPWPEVGLIPIIASLAGYLPVSIGGIGTVEYAATYLFNVIGIKTEIVLTTYIFMRIIQYFHIFILSILFGRSSQRASNG